MGHTILNYINANAEQGAKNFRSPTILNWITKIDENKAINKY